MTHVINVATLPGCAEIAAELQRIHAGAAQGATIFDGLAPWHRMAALKGWWRLMQQLSRLPGFPPPLSHAQTVGELSDYFNTAAGNVITHWDDSGGLQIMHETDRVD